MPARLSDPLPRASSRAAAAAYSRTRAGAASLREPRPRHTARPGTTWPGSGTNGMTPHEPGSGQYRPAATQGNTRSAQKAQSHCSAGLTCY